MMIAPLQTGQADVISLLTLSPDLKIDQRNDAGLTVSNPLKCSSSLSDLLLVTRPS